MILLRLFAALLMMRVSILVSMNNSQAQELTLETIIATNPYQQWLERMWQDFSFVPYSKDVRNNILKELYNEIQNDYAPYDIKKNGGIDIDELFKKAIEQENHIDDSPLRDVQAFDNLDFFDRLRFLVAQLNDTHFKLLPNMAPLKISNGLFFRAVGDEIYVVGMRKRILQYFEQRLPELGISKLFPLSQKIKVLSIDGRPIHEVVSKLSSYLSASSPLAKWEKTIGLLGERNFAYPDNRYSVWEFENLDESPKKKFKVKLPWGIYDDNLMRQSNESRADSFWVANLRGYFSLEGALSDWEVDANSTTRLDFGKSGLIGYANDDTPKGLRAPQIYTEEKNESSERILIQGFFLRQGIALCYIKLNSFSNSKVFDRNGNELETLTLIEDFLRDCQDSSKGIILDLRYNGGGSPTMAYQLARMMSPGEKEVHGTTAAYRLSQQFVEYVFHRFQNSTKFSEELEAIRKSWEKREPYSFIFERKANAHSFNQLPWITLIGPQCVSACDGFAWMVKSNHLAPLVGRPSNGTGAGFIGDNYFFTADYWKDSKQVIKVEIPTRLFGKPWQGEASDQNDPMLAIKLNTENRPCPVDIPLLPSIKDYFDKDSDTMDKASTILIGLP